MPLDQRIRKLGTPLYGLFKNKGLTSTKKQSYVARTYSRAMKALLNVHGGPPPIPPLPVELWIEIIHELRRSDWIALCRVCRSFYHIAQPCLYENVIPGNHNLPHELYKGRIGDSHQQFKRTLDQRPELGAYVRSLSLDMDDGAGPNDRERFPLLFELYLFPNLESLHVRHIHFNLEICNIIHSQPRLKSVTVICCTLDESLTIGRMDRDNFPHSSITMIDIEQPVHNPLVHAWAALAPAKLESLELWSRTFPRSDVLLILDHIQKLNKTSFLTKLSLDTFSPVVVRFLIASPQLRHLVLSAWMFGYDMSSPLPTDAIPFLEEYNGPAEISSTLIRGRPVWKVKLTSARPLIPEDLLIESLISLQYSSVPVTSLELSLFEVIVGSWLSHIPVTVYHFTFNLLHWLDFYKWLPALSHLTSLQTLSGTFYLEAWKKLRRDEIMQISNTCKSLREIDIGPRRWRMVGQRVWEPFTVFTYDNI